MHVKDYEVALSKKGTRLMSIIFPDWYDDLFQFECESKGVILNFEITVNGNTHTFWIGYTN
ncbi:hypothetical protein A9G38_09810 [Gilliamella sp. Imp1-1]|nr:hypothetical protein A9G38_09810 [Gilliamella apicola]